MTLLVGADPELFLKKGSTGFVSGHTIDCGSKHDPRPTKHGSVQNDGLALELNVTPAETKGEFLQNIEDILIDLQEIIEEDSRENVLVAQPTVEFGSAYLASLPGLVSMLGCNPDFNAYTGEANPIPDANLPIRTGAGHVHLGWTKDVDIHNDYDHYKTCCGLAKQLDYYLGLPSLLWDEDDARRTLYGRAGAFRPKAYGLEYRVLSNKWVSDIDLQALVFTNTVKAFETYQAGDLCFDRYGLIAMNSINRNFSGWRKYIPEFFDAIVGDHYAR